MKSLINNAKEDPSIDEGIVLSDCLLDSSELKDIKIIETIDEETREVDELIYINPSEIKDLKFEVIYSNPNKH